MASRRWREGMISSGGRQFDVCTGERREPPRRRKSMCCGDCQKELHLSSLALGNACFVLSCAASDVARPLLLLQEHEVRCCVRAASGRRARISAQVRCVGPRQTAAARPVLAIDSWSAHSSQSVDREADASAKRSGSDDVVRALFASHGLARAYRRMVTKTSTLAAGKTLAT